MFLVGIRRALSLMITVLENNIGQQQTSRGMQECNNLISKNFNDDQPAVSEVVDSLAQPLAAEFIGTSLAIESRPVLRAQREADRRVARARSP